LLVDCQEPSRAPYAALLAFPPGIWRTGLALAISGVPKVGRAAGNAAVVSSHERLIRWTDTVKAFRVNYIRFGAACLVLLF
jgi:hypothetical protein